MNPSAVLLLLVTLGWGTTFPLLKSMATDLNGIEISTFRCFFWRGFAGERRDRAVLDSDQ